MADEHTEPDPSEETDPPTEAGDEAAEGPSRTPVARKKVVSKRVTPKGGGRAAGASSTAASTRSKRTEDDDDEASFSSARYTPPSTRPGAQLPSPWWVPALMFGFLIVGALVIMLNYMGVFGDAENIRLIIGLGLILAGIITATQYR